MLVTTKAAFRVALVVAAAVHINRGNAEVKRFGAGLTNAAAAGIRISNLNVRCPAILDAGLDQPRQIFIQRAAGAMRAVKPLPHLSASRRILDLFEKRQAALNGARCAWRR